jgi:DNA-binding MurR/RpiR family transcriptional regulator
MKSILTKIYSEYKTFTASQQKIAEYLTQHLDDALILKANQLAKAAGVSEATFTRFITRLGFSGFSEFAETFGISDSVFLEILRGDVENIHKITNGISNELFEKAVEKLSSAKSIYLLGLRSSYALAFYLAFNLRFFLKSVTLIKPGIGDIPEQVLSAGKGDVLVALSFKRFTRDVVNIVEKIKRKKAYIMAITSSHLSPIAQLADMSLAVETEIPTYIESFTAPMSLLNAIITAVALKKKKQALPALTKLETELEAFETYISRDIGLNQRK